MNERDAAFLYDIVLEGRRIKRFLAGMTREEFEDDEVMQNAIVRLLTVIGEAANKVSPELRDDPKYGKFIEHRPAEARVEIAREDGKVRVVVDDFVSPTILERLEMDMPLFRAKVPDWRSMVDCVMVDVTYDGEVFGIDLSDVPRRKSDLVDGEYELDAPEGETTVAVKIIDMLGEEVLVTREV